MSDDEAHPFGWLATSPGGQKTLFTGAQPPTGYVSVSSLAAQADYDAAVAAMRAAASVSATPQSISRRQFFQQLATQGIITQAEALAAVQTGAIPSEMQPLVSGLPIDEQFAAEMMISGAAMFTRSDPLTVQLGAAKGWSADQIDALWTAASAL